LARDRNKTPAAYERKRRYRERHREELRAKNREYARKRYEEDREHEAERRRLWRAANPEKAAAIRAAFKERHPGYQTQKMREWRARHPERNAENAKRWRKENPEKYLELGRVHSTRRRVRIANAPLVEDVDRFAIYERDMGRCHICKKKASRDSFDLDHLVPLSRGGEHSAANMAVAHQSCNRRRGPGRLPAQLRLVG
jgi:5-methylcytosine-specific restriction endonuclease McrA